MLSTKNVLNSVLPLFTFAVATMGFQCSDCLAELKVDESLIDRKIDNFTLKDDEGHSFSLTDAKESRFIVVFFTGTECPIAKLYGARMERLHDEYANRGVMVIGICSNAQDSVRDIKAYAKTHGISFPVFKDQRNEVADRFGATRTPQVFVLDHERSIQYYGRIDGQFTFGSGVGLSQPTPKRKDLRMALDELLAGKPVSVPITEAKGCLIGREKRSNAESTVTYSRQIARLFQARCIECHRQGQIAPFALTDYDAAAGWGEMIDEVVREQRMPPWHANPAHGEFANENRLTEEEKQLVHTWVKNGCPEGDPTDLPEPKKFNEGWFLPQEPDLVIHMTDEPVSIKASGVENYRYYEIDPGFTEDKWVSMAECMPGNRSIVHHIIVYIKSPEAKRSDIGNNELLVGFAPGTRPYLAPPGWARRIPAGAKLLFELHYTPNGSPQKDRSSVGLVFADRKNVTHQTWTTNAVNGRFVIPPHASNHKVEAQKRFGRDALLLSMFPHMHMRGKSFRYEAKYPDGSQEILLDVPEYDFNWQNSFILKEPKMIPAGTWILCTAHYDNSINNLANPDPTKSVRWGQQTWEEMMIGWFDVAAPIAGGN